MKLNIKGNSYTIEGIDFSRILFLSFSLLFLISTLQNYNKFISILVLGFSLLLLIVTIYNCINGFVVLIFITIFFGNHPGGKYLEIFDMLLFLWISVSLFRINNIVRITFIKGLEWLFLLSGLLSIFSTPTLMSDIINNIKINPSLFNIFSANEANPVYVLKMLLTTLSSIVAVSIVYNVYIEEGQKIINKVCTAIAISLVSSILIGVLEANIPIVQSLLNTYHYFIDGYNNQDVPNIIPLFSLFQKAIAVQSLFWNRGWFAVFIIASIPFLIVALNSYLHNSVKLSKHKVLFWLTCFTFIFYILILVGARGAYISFIVISLFFIFLNITENRTIYYLRYSISGMMIVILVAIPLLVVYTNLGPIDGARFAYFKAGMETFIRNIFFGCGIEGYGVYNLKNLIPAGLGTKNFTTHNQLLQIASGQGIFGVLIYLSMIYYILFSLIESISEKKQYVIPLLSGFIGILVYSSFQEWYYLRSTQLFWWLLIMIIMAIVKSDSTDKAAILSEYQNVKRSVRLLFPIVLFVIIFVTLLFYIETDKTGICSKIYKALVQSETWPFKKEYGYYEAENWNGVIMRWTGKESYTSLKASGDIVNFNVAAFQANSSGSDGLRLEVSVNDLFTDTLHFFNGGEKKLSYCIPGIKDTDVLIKTKVSETFNPKELRINNDARDLGIARGVIRFDNEIPKEGIGFYNWEEWGGDKLFKIRWTGGRASVPLENIDLKQIQILCSHPDIEQNSVVVTVYVDDKPAWKQEVKDKMWKKIEFNPGSAINGKVVTFQVSRTWNPKSMGISADARDLGVAVKQRNEARR